jgi:hypothetical protein
MMSLSMPKDLVFKMRLDVADKERLDQLALHYSAPAATVVRMLVKRDADEVAASRAKKRWEVSLEGEDRALYGRVLKAYFARFGAVADQPPRGDTTIDSSGLIVLRGGRGTVARWRVRGGRLLYLTPKG